MRRTDLRPVVCSKCGNVFLGVSSDTVCPSCKNRKSSSARFSAAKILSTGSFWDIKRIKKIKRRRCVVCGKTFFANENVKTCSPECDDIRNSSDTIFNPSAPRRAGITQTNDGKWIASKMGVTIGKFDTMEEAKRAIRKKKKKTE